MSEARLILGDCIEKMRELPHASVATIVCDPPYGLEFMGKEWDRLGGARIRQPSDRDGRDGSAHNESTMLVARNQPDAYVAGPRVQEWHEAWAREALRVLKPGGHLLAFGGTRTYHRLACGLEDAGFEIRDEILAWMFGSGFPKSADPNLGMLSLPRSTIRAEFKRWWHDVRTTATGTALKPAHEPIVVARKPLAGTIAQNVLAYGTGALNIDGCRIAFQGEAGNYDPPGRWPANVVLVHAEECRQIGTTILRGDQRETGNGTRQGGFGNVGAENDDSKPNAPVYGDERAEVWECVEGCPVRMLDEQSGNLTSGQLLTHHRRGGESQIGTFNIRERTGEPCNFGGDAGGASRFFYCAKVSRAERNAGLEGFEAKSAGIGDTRPSGDFSERLHRGEREHVLARNNHPTVKPIALMRWLCRLVTPPGGTVLDPFLGSGSTGIAAGLEGLGFIGIEREADYMRIAEARMAFWAKHGEDGLRICAEREARASKREAIEKAGQLSLLA